MTEDDTGHFTAFDIETGNAERLYREPDPAYVKLIGYGKHTGPLMGVIPGLPTVTVNGHFFDFPALDRHLGIPVEATIPFSRDLRVAAFQHDPPTTYETSPGPGFKAYSMDALAERYLGDVRKSDLGKQLAKEFGGWDHVPADDPRLAEYLRADLEVTRRLNAAVPWDPYEAREAWIAAVTARTSLNGFRVDESALQARVRDDRDRAEDGRTRLAEDFGFPLTAHNGKPSKAPQRTKAGKAAFETALTAFGVDLRSWPRGEDGSLSLAKETLGAVVEWARAASHPCLPLVEAVRAMNGIRTNAENLQRCVSGGRVHPQFLPFQSTGRWSVLEPGLTVLKKGVADSERAYLLPEEGHVLISIDADQVDIRSVAAHAQDPALIALLNDPDRDLHTEISERAGVPRKQGKTLDLGWLYGRSARGMWENTPGMTRESAEAVCSYMTSAFPLVPVWQRRVRELGEAGVLADNGWGRRMRVDPKRAHTQAPAMYGQSVTREIVAEALLDIARRDRSVLKYLRLVVHDEVVLSAPREDAQEIGRFVRDCMTREWCPPGASVPVRFTAGRGEIRTAERWNDLYN